jgi:hypothetical protein
MGQRRWRTRTHVRQLTSRGWVAIGALIVVVICAVILSVRQHYAQPDSQTSDGAYLRKAMKDQEKMGWAHQ